MSALTLKMMRASRPLIARFLGMAAFALYCGGAHAAFYTHTPAAYNWIDPVAGSHTQAVFSNGAACTGGFSAAQDDDITAPIPLSPANDFTFRFGGNSYTQVRIQTNGRLQFASAFCGYGTETVGPPPTYPFDFPSGTPSSIGVPDMSNMIRVYGGDLDLDPATGGSGAVYYATLGTAPNRRFVVTWYNVKEWNNPTTLFNAQIILYEASGDFVFQYGNTINFSNGHAQIGWEISPADYDLVSYSTLGGLAFTAIRFYAAPRLAEWHLDDLAWSGSGGDVAETSGSYNATSQGGASTISTSPAIAGNPGTCRYGQFDGAAQYIALPGNFPDLGVAPATGNFTITAWIRTLDNSKSPQRIFGEDSATGYGLTLSQTPADAGKLHFSSGGATPASIDTGPVIQSNLWYYVAVTVDIAGATMTLYVYDATGGLLTSATAALPSWQTAAGAVTIAGGSMGGAGFQGNVDEVEVYSGALPQGTVTALALQTHLCAAEPTFVGGFNAFDASTPADATAGYIKTKVAGMPFDRSTGNLALVALTGVFPAAAIDTTFSGTVGVQLVDATTGAPDATTGCNDAWPLVANLADQTFSAGSGRITMSPVPQINNAAYKNLRVRINYPASGTPARVGCSNDAFALRPALLAVSATHQDWQTAGAGATLNTATATGGQVHKAWRYFTLRATASDAAGNALASYSGSPMSFPSAVLLPSSCASCSVGTMEPGTWGGTGTITSDTARYAEAGSFVLYVEDRSFAAVDAADTPPGDLYIPSNTITVGRFVPDHFDVTPKVGAPSPVFRTFNKSDAQCNTAVLSPRRAFTYFGQAFGYATTPQATITARNAGSAPPPGDVTRNYQGALWKIGGSGSAGKDCTSTPNTCVYTTTFAVTGSTAVETYTYALNTGAAPGWDNPSALATVATVTSNDDGTGILSYASSDQLGFVHSPAAALVPAAASILDTVRVTDNSEGAAQIITTTNPAQFASIAFDSGSEFRYGRLQLKVANGSELLPLSMTIAAQYFIAGAGFINNGDDNCTALSAANLGLGNYQLNLNPGETTISMTGSIMAGGVKGYTLSAPGAGNTGSVDVVLNLGPSTAVNTCLAWTPSPPAPAGANLTYLREQFCGPNFDHDPTAHATFGNYNVNQNFIYQRENY